MDMNFPPFGYVGYESNFDPSIDNVNSMFNPLVQYEQAYMYYRYMTQQLEYKIKCKEYDKICYANNKNDLSRNDRRD